ncbi:iron dicitrate transport regulator FecR [Variovorax sp. KBS0712]|uniref:Iron dicitrate transport regulator FecR n=1 Tax=Variovorax boronicumulans TaxID=436515 RepID=A0A250DP42_9BURK|nr:MULTISPECIES: FecR domain-containing protein [Variovorax]ATA56032.1 iron dicitrate transport regulator FecR [Variovorax boronicumulans]TSD59476.1 iron dicitrate transport regulator FecR [Variovorax sp. KBS0712]
MSRAATAVVPRERLIERALALIVEDEIAPPSPAANSARLALDQWRTRSPEHAAAVREARERWNALGGMADDLRAHFDEPVPASAPRNPSRRKMLLSVAGLLGAGVVAGRGVQWYWQQPVFQATYRTPNARMLKVTLADAADASAGSRLDLAPQSAVDVTLYRRRRMIDMARGEVRFDVAPDAERPFVVRTREAIIEVVGTAFTVRDRGGPITVGVEHGHVRVQVLRQAGTERSGEVVDLRAGDMLEVRDGHADPVRQADTAALSAWRDGWLVFDNTPLGDALAAVNSYRSAPIVGADARIDAMRLSGRFRTNDSAGLLDALPAILPLVAVARPDGSVRLQAR